MPATKTDNMLSSLRLGVIERLALSFWAGTLPEALPLGPSRPTMRPKFTCRSTPSSAVLSLS